MRTGLAVEIPAEPLMTVARGAGLALEELRHLPSAQRSKRRAGRR
jgi:actin-like ATPase involved in cell morphogenesis